MVGGNNDSSTGILVNIAFTVFDNAPHGEAFITVSHDEIFDRNGRPITLSINQGGINVLNEESNNEPVATPEPTPTPDLVSNPTPEPTPSPMPSPTPDGEIEQTPDAPSSDNEPSATTPTPSPSPVPIRPAEPSRGQTVEEVVVVGTVELLNVIEHDEDLEIEATGVTVINPHAVLVELIDADNVEDLTINITVSYTGDNANNLLSVAISIAIGTERIDGAPATVIVPLDDFDIGGINSYRLVAMCSDGTILGGRFDTETGTFVLKTEISGEFIIAYVETLNRLSLHIGLPAINDLAANALTQIMDMPPVIIDDRTLLPVRFMAYALGADVDWSPATDYNPLIVHLALDGQNLSFGIGEITPELAALGMDVPAQIIESRTMVPLRFISEFFGAVVSWDDENRSIEVISNAT